MPTRFFQRYAVALLLLTMLSLQVFAQSGNIPSTFRGSPVSTFDVIASYPHDPTAYTQGLVFHDGVLYESTGHYGKSTLRIVDLETGDISKKIDLDPSEFGEGMTIFDGKVYQLTWKKGVCHVYSLETWEPVGEFTYSGEGWGLTHDGTHLIMSSGAPEINYLDPETFRIVKTLSVWDQYGSVPGLNELEYIDGEIWANVLPTDLIARIDPDTGEIKAWVYLDGLLDQTNGVPRPEVLNGIAFDQASGNLYLTGKYWPRLYQVEIFNAD